MVGVVARAYCLCAYMPTQVSMRHVPVDDMGCFDTCLCATCLWMIYIWVVLRRGF